MRFPIEFRPFTTVHRLLTPRQDSWLFGYSGSTSTGHYFIRIEQAHPSHPLSQPLIQLLNGITELNLGFGASLSICIVKRLFQVPALCPACPAKYRCLLCAKIPPLCITVHFSHRTLSLDRINNKIWENQQII